MTNQKAMLLVAALLLLLAVPSVKSQLGDNATVSSLEVDFKINPDLSVRQSMNFSFSTEISESPVSYTISENIRNIEVSDGSQKLEFSLLPKGDAYDLQISLKKPTKSLTISYDLDNVVFKSDSVDHFFTEFSFEKPIEKLKVEVKLPEGYSIYQNSYRPGQAGILSDGRFIILSWEMADVRQPVFFSVKFTKASKEINIWPAVAILLAGGLVAFYFYSKKRTKEEFLRGFRTDEQKVLEYLQSRKTATQNEIKKEFQFSRAKATRIVMKLQEKQLVEKERLGRTNKLVWKKNKGIL